MSGSGIHRREQLHFRLRRFLVIGALAVCAVSCARASSRVSPSASASAPSTTSQGPAPSVAPVSVSVEPSLAKPAALTPEQAELALAAAAHRVSPKELPPELTGGGKQAVRSEFGMVTSVEGNATRAGVEILEAGGNAVDAAVAVGYALAVTHPTAGNVGGGGFMLVRLQGSATVALDFREVAPKALTQSFFDQMIAAKAQGPAAVGVPGSVAGLNQAQQRFGKLTLARVLAPAIRLAAQGHRLGERQAKSIGWAWPVLEQDSEAKSIFGQGNRPKRQGELLVQRDLARTLERIAERGDAGFYTGETAQALVAALQHGGIITLGDLSEYQPRERQVLDFFYRGYEVQLMPPPSAGGVAVVQMLRALEQLGAEKLKRDGPQMAHLFVEVAKRAHAERRFGVVDPDSVEGYDALERRRRWYDPETSLSRAPIDPKVATPAERLDPLFAAASRELEHTTHFSVSDAQGNVVSCTMTLSAGFGARFVAKGTGVVLNNTLAAFGTVGDDVPKPGRRMTSSMTPTLVLRGGQPVLILGSPGGDTIPNTVVQVLRNVIDYHMTIDEAVDAPRLHHGFVPDEVRYEAARPPPKAVLAGLRSRGHKISAKRISIGDANNILLRGSIAYGFADRREGGLALGPPQAPPDLSSNPVAD